MADIVGCFSKILSSMSRALFHLVSMSILSLVKFVIESSVTVSAPVKELHYVPNSF